MFRNISANFRRRTPVLAHNSLASASIFGRPYPTKSSSRHNRETSQLFSTRTQNETASIIRPRINDAYERMTSFCEGGFQIGVDWSHPG